MISKVQVCRLIDEATKEFLVCWEILRTFREGPPSEGGATGLFSLQPRLARAIYRTERMQTSARREEKATINRKSALNKDWFRRRISRLVLYKKALKEAASVGRAIGDSFAWIFYHRERTYLSKQMQQQAVNQ